MTRFHVLVTLLAACILSGPASGQSAVRITVFKNKTFSGRSLFEYQYTVTNNPPSTVPITRWCIDFRTPLPDLDIASVVVPPGWVMQPPVPGVNAAGTPITTICFKCTGTPPAAIPPGGALGGFRIPTNPGTKPNERFQLARFFTSTSCVGPFTQIGGPITIAGNLGATQILPEGQEFVMGDSSSPNPWGTTASQIHQFVYNEVALPGQQVSIDRIGFRQGLSSPTSPGGTGIYTITLASAANTFNFLSPTFANNRGLDATIVFSGPITVAPQTLSPGVATPTQWINLTTPFIFNAGLGQDLLVQIEKCGSGNLALAVDGLATGSQARGVRNFTSCTSPTGSLSTFAPALALGFSYAPVFQVNDVDLALTLDDRVQGGLAPIKRTTKAGAPVQVEWFRLDQAPTLGMEIGLTLAPPVRGDAPFGLITAGGQALNLDLAHPTFFPVFGGTFPPFAGSSVTVAAIAGDLAAQMVVLNTGNPEGFTLSAPVHLQGVVPAGGSTAGPTGNDDGVFVNLASIGAPPVRFFGTDFPTIKVMSDGRIQMVFGDPDATPTVVEARTRYPMVGAWVDFDPSLGGSIIVSSNSAGIVTVLWNNVPYAGNPALTGTLSIAFNTAGEDITIDGLASLPVFPAPSSPSRTNLMVLGLSGGDLIGATDAGPQNFVAGVSVQALPGEDMVYLSGQAGTVAPGVDRLVLTYDILLGNYGWSAHAQ